MTGTSKKHMKIATVGDLKFARERLRYEVRLQEQAIFSNFDQARFIFINSTRQALLRAGQRMMLMTVFKHVRNRFFKRRKSKDS